MAIEKPMEPFPMASIEEDEDAMDVEVTPDEGMTIEETEDGGVVITFGDSDEGSYFTQGHGANLAEDYEDTELALLASELLMDFEMDRRSRNDWATAYVKGLDLLGLKIEERTQPWNGASGVFHPLLMEAVVRFQAQAMGEIFPAQGPARTDIAGYMDQKKIDQAHRVERELNYLLTEEMTEYRDETEHMLFKLALAGSAFKKVYFDPLRGRPVAMFVPAEDFVVNYGTSDLETCPRYTHVMKQTANDVLKLQLEGFYRDVDLPPPSIDYSDVQEKYDKLSGENGAAAVVEDDDRHTVLEMHVDLDLPGVHADPDGVERPYIVTIDKSSMTILSIRRNWYENDKLKLKRMHFAHYRYLPGMGFYGIGLIHLIGGLAKSATSILRQLIDAGTLSNLPAGLKARGMRIKGDDTPIRPGEFRDVDVPGMTIHDSITFIPYKEPSNVLYQLLGNVVDEGRRVGSIADVDIGSMSQEAPVGTTLALLERSMKVMSGVQARLHASLRRELKLIARVVHDFMPSKYKYTQDGDFDRKKDFDGRVDVLPVSDPNASTMAQRVVQYQAALQLSQQAPQLYDMGKLHRQMLEVLNIQDAGDIVKLPDDLKPADPVTENMCILKQEPVKAFEYQDHEAHIRVHMAALNDPKIAQMVGQSPFASAIQSAMTAHITEHVAMQYRVEIQKQLGAPMPGGKDGEELPPDMERQVSRLAAEAADKLLRESQHEAAQAQQQAEDQDPLNVIQRMELEIKAREVGIKEMQVKHGTQLEEKKFDLQVLQAEHEAMIAEERLRSEDKRIGAQIGARLATQLDTEQRKDKREGAKIGLAIAKELFTDAEAREQADAAKKEMNRIKSQGDRSNGDGGSAS